MTKQELLKKMHKLIWKDDDIMDQDTLFTLQELVDTEIIKEAKKGSVKIEQLENGYIKNIELN